jgi:hydroxypyruvate reductase
MSDALLTLLTPALRPEQSVAGVVVGSTPPARKDGQITFLRGSHPLPDAGSRRAAAEILALLSSCDERTLVLFLISGGASAMVERALGAEFTAEDEAAFHRALVHSGLPITEINALRKHFSAVKGGRLAVAAGRSAQCTLLILDVPGDRLHVVGSGPSLPDPSTVAECREILAANGGSLRLPERVADFFASNNLPETPKRDHPAFARAGWASVLSSDDLCLRAREEAERRGFHTVIDNSCDDWAYRDAAVYLVRRLGELRREHGRVCLLSAGEVVVELPPHHGVGGRNLQFALECARLLNDGGVEGAAVLSGGSDGVDGNSPAAGAVCDGMTATRAESAGIDWRAALDGFNSFPAFAALGDALVIGPTGNNVRDLRILLSEC